MARRRPEARTPEVRGAAPAPTDRLPGEAVPPPIEAPRRSAPHGPEAELADRLRTNASLEGIDLREARLVDLVFDGKNLARAKFSEAELVRCSFVGCSLVGAVFFGATLKEVSFARADLEGADLDYTSLLDVGFHGARLRGASLPGRSIGRARFEESVRTGALVRLSARRNDEE